jgi:hypothetical protein
MNKLLEIRFGSHLYGCATENSDLDLKAIYIPTGREIVLNSYKKTISTTRPKQIGERNTKDDVDIEVFSLDRYLELLAQGQTCALDMLFANESDFTFHQRFDQIWPHIKKNKDKLLSKDVTAFFGYAKVQAQKYGLKGFRVAAFKDALDFVKQYDDNYNNCLDDFLSELQKFVYKRPCSNPEPKNEYITIVKKSNPAGVEETFLEVCGKFYSTKARIKYVSVQLQKKYNEYGERARKAEKNEGIDFKACSHAVRVNYEGVELLKTGNITFPRPDRELLLSIKKGELPYKEIEEIILQGFEDLKLAQVNSTLRDKPDREWINDFVYDIYSAEVKNEDR